MDVYDCPEIRFSELTEKIRDEITLPEFLFYKSEIADGSGFLEDADCWRVYCSRCGGNTLIDKEWEPKAGNITICPMCGETVKPRRWRSRKELGKQTGTQAARPQFLCCAGRRSRKNHFVPWNLT